MAHVTMMKRDANNYKHGYTEGFFNRNQYTEGSEEQPMSLLPTGSVRIAKMATDKSIA